MIQDRLQIRARFASRCACVHLFISAMVALLAAIFVFVIWYPSPIARMLEVGHVYVIVLMVDVVCGPLLTLILASPEKKRYELILDFSIIIFIQIGALAYGLVALESARPVAFVFEQDRLVVVTKNELYTADCFDHCQNISLWRMQWWISNFDLTDGEKNLKSLDLSLQGISLAMRPSTWKEWFWDSKEIQSKLIPLRSLGERQKMEIAKIKGAEYLDEPARKYLPLVSSKNLDWIAVFDHQGRWIDSFPVDGFYDEK